MEEEYAIYYEIPAQDSMGRLHINGKLRALEDRIILYWKIADRTFKKTSKEMQTIDLDYAAIETVELQTRMFFNKDLVIKVRDPKLLEELPGAEMGKVVLQVSKKSKPDAARFINHVDYKVAEIAVNVSMERMNRAREEL